VPEVAEEKAEENVGPVKEVTEQVVTDKITPR